LRCQNKRQMGKKLNKRELIKECLEGIEEKATDEFTIEGKDLKLFRKEAKKIVSDFVKSYRYDTDMFGNECIDDYSYFQDDLMSEIYGNTSFFKKLYDFYHPLAE